MCVCVCVWVCMCMCVWVRVGACGCVCVRVRVLVGGRVRGCERDSQAGAQTDKVAIAWDCLGDV